MEQGRCGREALDNAVEAARRACAMPGSHETDRAIYLSNRGIIPTAAAGRTRLGDLEEAVEVLREATGMGLPSAADRALYLRNLSVSLSDLFERVGEVVVLLQEAAACGRTAVALAPATRTGFDIREPLIRSLLRLRERRRGCRRPWLTKRARSAFATAGRGAVTRSDVDVARGDAGPDERIDLVSRALVGGGDPPASDQHER